MTQKTEKSKLSFEDQCFQWASGFYLTDHLPDDFFIHDPETCDLEDWEEYKDGLLENNLWEPFEFYVANQIASEIASLSHWIENGNYPKKEDTTLTNDERYEFIKLYDILRDMDFELTEKQVSVFEKIQEGKNV